MVDYKEIPSDGETWELFARDFLTEKGFIVESPPDRGADGGKDILIHEFLKGYLSNYSFRWLVSCKHFAHTNKSVSETDEPNILERIESFGADGFIGFYSTIPSSGLNSRLFNLKKEKKIKDYKIFDSRLIESSIIQVGYAFILQRYFPQSYKIIKPLELVYDEYYPLKCVICNKDLLKSLYDASYTGILIFISKISDEYPPQILDVKCVCKGKCDEIYEKRLFRKNLVTSWCDIHDLLIPPGFLRYCFSIMNNIKENNNIYTDEAFDSLKKILIAISQKVLRSTTEKEKEIFRKIINDPLL